MVGAAREIGPLSESEFRAQVLTRLDAIEQTVRAPRREAYSITETAKVLGCARSTVEAEIKRGALKSTYVASRLAVRASEIDRYLAAGEGSR